MIRTVLTLALAAALTGAAAGPAEAAYELAVSSASDRSSAVPLAGRALSSDQYVFVRPDSGATRVRFWLDDPQRVGPPRMTESRPPWDFMGTASTGRANPFKTADVGNGAHTITAVVDLAAGGSEVVSASFTVDNTLPPDQIHVAWTGDPASTFTVTWRTRSSTVPHTVQYRLPGGATWLQTTGAARPSGTAGTLHETTITGLQPGTAYEYRVPGDGGAWSPVMRTRTAPAGNASSFDAVYYADTGLVGRTDGLATGTAQAIQEIAALDPLLVLPGGDYAYFDTDKRYSTLERTIDEWFNQQQPVLSRAATMPTYGNHEVLLGEGFDPWARRFPTPAGTDGRRLYSFDVAGVHFISLLAVHESIPLTSAHLSWLNSDIAAAKAAGARWIVPYMHVSPFADGFSHPSNLALRAQLGPVFEQAGIKLVLTSHDQSYERTWPLTGVPAAIAPTSSSLRCYELTDGVTWAKVSPAGKLSNKTTDFSVFQTFPPPLWTAVRDDTQHHFARLRVGATSLRLDVYGLEGDGTPAAVVDTFEYRSDGCPDRVSVTPSSVVLEAVAGGSPRTATVAVEDPAAATWSASDDAPWLTVGPPTGATASSIELRADPGGLAPATYSAKVTVSAVGREPVTVPVTLKVQPDGHALLVSSSSSRNSPRMLAGTTLAGNAYVITGPDAGVSRVSFWLDDPAMASTPRRIENSAPFDFAGGNATTGAALPWDTRKVADGQHIMTARLETAAGPQVVHATFEVDN